MYAESTASRASQHRVAMEKHAQAARQAKIAQAAARKTHRAPAKRTPIFAGWVVTALHRAPQPLTV